MEISERRRRHHWSKLRFITWNLKSRILCRRVKMPLMRLEGGMGDLALHLSELGGRLESRDC